MRTESEQAFALITWFKPFNGVFRHKEPFERHFLKEICIQLTEAREHPGALEGTVAVISVGDGLETIKSHLNSCLL